jgi:threonine dehydratase
LIALPEIERARETIRGAAIRTPLVRLPDTEIWLKLENLQPIGSFKIRGATNAIRQATREELANGVVTASAGNMAQGVAWAAREAGVPATIVVPEHAPETKLAAIERLGGRVLKVPYDEWWQTIEQSRHEGVEGLFIHPVQNERVMAGNGTIGLELLEDLPDLGAVLIPFGAGGLTAGIASALKAKRPGVRVYAVEPETAAPLGRSLAEGAPQEVEYSPSFVDGAGAPLVLPQMWTARRARSRDRRGRRRARPRRGPRGPRGLRQDRLHRLGREHRLLATLRDLRRKDPRMSGRNLGLPGR